MPRLAFDDFSAGLWIPDEAEPTTEQAQFAIPRNALLQADNLDYLTSGAVRGRRGSAKNNASALPGAVRAMHRYYSRGVPTSQVGRSKLASVLGRAFSDPINFPMNAALWTNVRGVGFVFDGSAAQCIGIGGTKSQFLTGINCFLYAPIPSDAIVNGFQVRVIRTKAPANVGTVTDGEARLMKAGALILAANRANATPWSGTLELITYGGSGDLWGATWTPAEVNANGFGFALAVDFAAAAQVAQVHWIEIRCYFTSSAGDRFLVAYVSGTNLVYATGSGGTYTPVSGGTVANPIRRPRLVFWPQKGTTYLFDGENPAKQYNGTIIEDIPTDTDVTGGWELAQNVPARKGPFACLHKNRLFATEPSENQFSVYASDINNETVWRPENQLACNDERGGTMTGLASFGDQLLIFKDTALFAFVGDIEFGGQLTQLSTTGCVAPDSIAVTPHGVVFLGRDGLYLTDGEHVIPVSDSIRALFVERGAAHVYPNAVGLYYPRRDQYWIHFDPGVDTNGYVLHRLLIPTQDGTREQLAWSRVPGLPMNCGAVWGGGDDEGELYLGDVAGFVWLRDTGSADAGSAYTTGVRTAEKLVDPARLLGRAVRVRPIYRGAAPLSGAVRYDQALADDVAFTTGVSSTSGGGALPIIQEPREYLSDKAKFGRFLSVRVQSSEGPAFELYRVDVDLQRRGVRVWR